MEVQNQKVKPTKEERVFYLQNKFLKACREEAEHERKFFRYFPEYFSKHARRRENVPLPERIRYEHVRETMKARIYALAAEIERHRFMTGIE